jgi:hypothetical protein
VAFDAGNTVELTAGNGDTIQLSGPGHRYFEFCRGHGASIVPLPEVDDLDQASAELGRMGMFRAVVSWGIRPACSPVYGLPRSAPPPAWCMVARSDAARRAHA